MTAVAQSIHEPRTNGQTQLAITTAAQAFELRQREAKAIAASDLLPQAFRNNLANVLVAMEIAERIHASIFMVAQNLAIVHGRPSWLATFLIATVNASRRFTPLRFRFEGTRGKDDWGCRAVAKDRESGEECQGPIVTIAIAKAEGWYDRNGSKWKTLPELMLHYRAAAWWTRVFSPELSLGMQTSDEVEDSRDAFLPADSTPLAEVQAALDEVAGRVPSPAPASEPATAPPGQQSLVGQQLLAADRAKS